MRRSVSDTGSSVRTRAAGSAIFAIAAVCVLAVVSTRTQAQSSAGKSPQSSPGAYVPGPTYNMGGPGAVGGGSSGKFSSVPYGVSVSGSSPGSVSPSDAPGTYPGMSGQQSAMPGQLMMPGMGGGQPKVVGKGYIHYSYKGGPVSQSPIGVMTPDLSGGNLYVIQQGDNLWNLAGAHLSDPWRWREIWERNTYIENPDLIFPGKELALSADMLAASPRSSAFAPPPLDSSFLQNPQSFGDATAGFLEDTTLSNADSLMLAQKQEDALLALHVIIKKKILTSEFLAGSAFLWRQRDAKGLLYPGDARIDPFAKRESFQQFDDVPVKVFGKVQYRVGDTLEIYRSLRMVTYKKQDANLVRRIGHAVVTEAKGARLSARLVEVWDVVKAGDRVGKAVVFPRLAVGDYLAPEQEVSAVVFERVEMSVFPYPFHSFIVDRGSTDGVRVGDLFLAYNTTTKDASMAPAQLACAVHVGEDYATLATVRLYNNSLLPGDKVSLVKRVQVQ